MDFMCLISNYRSKGLATTSSILQVSGFWISRLKKPKSGSKLTLRILSLIYLITPLKIFRNSRTLHQTLKFRGPFGSSVREKMNDKNVTDIIQKIYALNTCVPWTVG